MSHAHMSHMSVVDDRKEMVIVLNGWRGHSQLAQVMKELSWIPPG